jgi:hypothetical protein
MPRSSKRAADAALAATSRFRRTGQWNGLVAGDAVRIAGIRGGHWRFRNHVENLETGSSWLEVDELDLPRGTAPPAASGGAPDAAGGQGSDGESRPPPVRRVRAFSEERVLPLRVPRRRRSAGGAGAPLPAGGAGAALPAGGAGAALPAGGGRAGGGPGSAVQLAFAGLLEQRGSDGTKR